MTFIHKVKYIDKPGGIVQLSDVRKWYVFDGETWRNGRKPTAALSKQMQKDLQKYWDSN